MSTCHTINISDANLGQILFSDCTTKSAFVMTSSKRDEISPKGQGKHPDIKHSSHSNFLYIYFLFAYYLLLTPFRFKKLQNGCYKLHNWFPQQILCGIATVLSLIRLATNVRGAFIKVASRNPVYFFVLFCDFSSLIFKSIAFRIFWTKGKMFTKLINFLNLPIHVAYNPFKIASIPVNLMFCGFYATLSVLRTFVGSTVIDIQEWSAGILFRRLVAEAHYTFLFSPPTNDSFAVEFKDINPFDYFLTTLQVLSMQSRFITGYFVDMIILIHILSLWAPACGFSAALYDDIFAGMTSPDTEDFDKEQEKIDVACLQYEALKNLAILTSESMGKAIVPFIIESTFFFAVYFDNVLLSEDAFMRVVLFGFYLLAACVLIFAAEIVRQVQWFRTWLGERNRISLLGENQRAMLFDSLSQDEVGITAVGICTIDYGFVGVLISVLITYFIIRLQTNLLTV